MVTSASPFLFSKIPICRTLTLVGIGAGLLSHGHVIRKDPFTALLFTTFKQCEDHV